MLSSINVIIFFIVPSRKIKKNFKYSSLHKSPIIVERSSSKFSLTYLLNIFFLSFVITPPSYIPVFNVI